MRPKAKPLKTTRSEAEVMTQILEAADMLGIDLQRQNTGGFTNPKGQYVQCGQPGNSDLIGVLKDGRALMIECKREGFNPAKARGEERERFERQLARLRRTNEQGGIGFFCDNAETFIRVMQIVLRGGRVEQTEHDLIVYDPEITEEQP